MNNIDQIYANSGDDVTGFAKGYLKYLAQLLEKLDCNEIAAFVSSIMSARERGARVFFIGNGGSAATASHFANDLSIGSRCWERPYRVSALTDNQAIITAIANDYGYEEIFVLQLKTMATSGDVLVAISASGNSSNLIKAVNFANKQDITTISLTGFDGGTLRPLCDLGVHIETPKGEYGPVEDIHMVLDHLCGAFLLKGSAG